MQCVVEMANPEHVEVVKGGAEAIKEWRQKHPNVILNLHKANLTEIKLSNADLHECDLSECDLSGAKLNAINMTRADMSHAILANTSLIDVDLSHVKLANALVMNTDLFRSKLSGTDSPNAHVILTELVLCDLDNANLSETDFLMTTFHYCEFLKTNFRNSRMSLGGFSSCDLSQCIGLETVKHTSPSSIGIETLISSFGGAGNRFTPELETFFTDAGVPKQLLDGLPEILAEVKYCSCFVCYGQPDLAFAERLVKDLRASGVSCWLYSMDSTPGKRVWGEITQRRREAEKMIVLCSAKSLIRDGVLKEIEEQIDENPEKIVPISLDDTWREDGFVIRRGKREDLKTFLLDRTYADFSDKSKYNDSLNRLLKGIKRT